ncbi:MAG: 4-hydroxy-tetrahydrodipicolinate reductase, partial [Gammaproteobacteria bacterium]|nr:4-hydroxy-tetrahydrodipicolinate reductase [Gammaproteobacteria bacterium]
MLDIAVTGAAGRMGRNLIQACYENTNCQLGAAIEHSSSPYIGSDAGEMAGVG